jgi:Spy/CpxP family protein refolding chaperone
MASMRFAWGGLWLVLGASVGSVACGSGAANSPPAATAASATAEDDATGDLTEHHRFHHHGGVTLLIAMSLDSLGVSPDQRVAVEKIRNDLHAQMEPARSAEESLFATLSDGLAAGTIETTKVDAEIAQATSAAAATPGASAQALNDLHSALTPPQRAALADKVEAHWAVWQRANAEVTGAGNPDGAHLARLTEDLGLSPDQVEKIRAGLDGATKGVAPRDPREIAAYVRAFGDAFRTDRFDARELTMASEANAHMVGWGESHLAHIVEAANPVLTPDQRTKLGERLREHAAHDPSGHVSP